MKAHVRLLPTTAERIGLEAVYKRAQVHAAEHGTSVSGLPTKYLMSLTSRDDQYERLKRLQESVSPEIIGFRAEERLSRDDVHDRALH